jgi:hypothetical protein
MDRALLTPFREGQADQVGKRLFRKQILPIGEIEYEGETLAFTRETNDALAQNFTAGAFDQVPVLLANEANQHHSDPEKFRGEVKALESTDDGLYGVLELTEDGAKLIESNPKLGVSARIIRGLENGKDALQHVLGTLDPKVTGMKPWEAVSLSVHQDAEVVDLTDEKFAEAGEPTPPASSSTVSDKLNDTEKGQLADLLKRGGAEAAKDALASTDISDEEVERVVSGLIESATAEEPVAALSEEDRKKIDLATERANDADRRAREAAAELANERYNHKRTELLQAGVPPKLVDLAEPVLKGEAKVIELSNGSKIDASDTVSKMLDEFKGMIDLSVIGRGDGAAETDEAAEARQKAQEWAEAS